MWPGLHPSLRTSVYKKQVDASVAIRHLKRYITDTVLESYIPEAVKALPKNGKSVGIIGAGPPVFPVDTICPS